MIAKRIMVGVFVAVISGLGFSPSLAIDEDSRLYRAYGVGPKKCEVYVQLRERELPGKYTAQDYENTDEVVAQWVAGYMTAHNYYVRDTFDAWAGSSLFAARIQSNRSSPPWPTSRSDFMRLASRMPPATDASRLQFSGEHRGVG